MNGFNQELISKVKIFQSEESVEDIVEEKYSFLQYIFKNLETREIEDLTLCQEEFLEMQTNIDGFFYDEDSLTYNLYIALYNENNDDNSLVEKEQIDLCYSKISNFLKNIITKNYRNFPEESLTFDISEEISKQLKTIELVVNIISNYNIPTAYKKDDIEEIEGINVSFRTYDLQDLQDKLIQISKESNVLVCCEKFGQEIKALRISSNKDFDVYMFSMKGEWLAQLYKEDSTRLLEPNVRAYLKKTSRVNSGIFETVKSYPEQFVTYNNGISAVATNVNINTINSNINFIKTIDNFQIVNGGQTTATLFECFKEKLSGLDDVIVPVKLTVVKNLSNAALLISNISVYSNTQTAIKKSDPPSNLPYYIDMKKLSLKCISTYNDNSYICYFERTNGEYDTELRRNNSSKRFTNTNPRERKFTKIDLAIAIDCWQQLPYKVAEGREKNFSFYNDVIKNLLFTPDEEYFKQAYATIILFRAIDKLAKKLKLSYKSNVVTYTLSLMSYITNKQIDLLKIWEQKSLPLDIQQLALDLLPKVHQIIIDTPAEHPEARMWARKESCWNRLKNITTNINVNSKSNIINFFPTNEAQLFIDNDDNFYNSILWNKLLIWNEKYKVLNYSQIKMIKAMKTFADRDENRLTKKQISYVKDIFMIAVKNKFLYK